MSTTNESNGTFARAFLPGLVLGLIIGGVAGAMLPELMRARPPAPTHTQIEQSKTTDRDESQSPPEVDPADEPAIKPEAQPEPKAEPTGEPG